MNRYNGGAISRNAKKQPGDAKPNYTGTANIGGVEYWISGWIHDRKDGSGKFLSLAFQVMATQPTDASGRPMASAPAPAADSPVARPAAPLAAPAKASGEDPTEFNDPLPF